MPDWEDHPAHGQPAYETRYAFGDGPLPHIHGANLGIRASAYCAVRRLLAGTRRAVSARVQGHTTANGSALYLVRNA